MDILTRVRHLISLARSATEEEARSAAVQACRLIRDQDLEVVSRGELEALRASMDELAALRAFVERAEATARPTSPETPRKPRRRSRPEHSDVPTIVSRAAGDVVSGVLRDVFRRR